MTWSFHLKVLLLCSLVSNVDAAKILMFPFGHFNHLILKYTEHLSALLAENHSVHVLINSGYEPSTAMIKAGVKLIKFERPLDAHTKEQNLNMSLAQYADMSMYDFYRLEGDASVDFCKAVVKDKQLLQTLKDHKFDLMFIDCVELCGRIIASHLDLPAITLQWDLSVAKMENLEFSFDLSYFPHDFLPNIRDVMTFPQRLSNVVDFILGAYSMAYFQKRLKRIGQQNKLDVKTLDDLSLIYGNFPFEYPTLTSPDMVFAGDVFIPQPTPLPDDVEKFIAGESGVVVVSFSDFIYDYGERCLTIFSTALSEVPYKVIWHYQGSVKPPGLSKNVKIVKKFQRSSYLAHPKVKLFISGSTVGDAYEATHFGVPIIAIPLNMDGYRDAARLAKHFKMGVKMELLQLTSISLSHKITEVMRNPEFLKNAEDMKSLVREQPIDSRLALNYWIDYMIKYKSAAHLIPYGRHMPWYKYYLIDVIIVFKIAVLLLIYAMYRIVRYLRGSTATQTAAPVTRSKED